jgi:hypothetical protein
MNQEFAEMSYELSDTGAELLTRWPRRFFDRPIVIPHYVFSRSCATLRAV